MGSLCSNGDLLGFIIRSLQATKSSGEVVGRFGDMRFAVAVRTRANTVEGTMPVSDFIARCVELRDTKAKDPPPPDVPEPVKGKGGGGKKK